MFGLADGVGVGVLSRDPAAIEEALAAYNGIFPSVFHRDDLQPLIDKALASDARDRGWMVPGLMGLGGAWPETLSFALTLDEPDRFDAMVQYPAEPVPELPVLNDDVWSAVLPRLAGTSAGYAASTPALTAAFLEGSVVYPWMAPFRSLVLAGEFPVEAAAAGLLADAYSGRLMGIKIPTLVVAVKVRDGADPRPVLADLIDRVNAGYQWQLVPRYEEVAGIPVAILESGGMNLYATLGRNETPAVALLDGWLVIGSNLRGLTGWLTAPLRSAALDPVVAGAASGRDGLLGLWFDLDAGGSAIRLALSGWSLKRLLEDPRESADEREMIREIKAWIDSLAPLDTLTLSIRHADGVATWDLAAGGGPAPGEPTP
jgi:hypothetical protein